MHSNKPHNFVQHERSLRKYSLTLRHIGHTRTNNGLYKLVEALL